MSEIWKHPEQADDETYIGNCTEESFFRKPETSCFDIGTFDVLGIGWTTKRMGTVAYDKDNNLIEQKPGLPSRFKLVPVFVKTQEIIKAGLDPKSCRPPPNP